MNNEIYNNFLSLTNNSCFASDSAEIIGNQFTLECLGKCKSINVANIGGNLNATCTINQQLSQSASSIISSQLNQQAQTSSDLFNDFTLYNSSKNRANVTQTVSNNIININSNTCNSDNYAKINDNVFNIQVNNSGDISAMTITSDQNSKCAIDNMTKQETHSSVQAGIKQSAKTMGMFVAIATALFGIMMIGLIVIVIIFAGGSVIKATSGRKKETPAPASATPASASLGATPASASLGIGSYSPHPFPEVGYSFA